MNNGLRSDADKIIAASIKAVQPDEAVKRALKGQIFSGKVILVSAGKAGWQMAKAASDYLGNKISLGIVITKYNHVMGELPNIICKEAGHPVPDSNSFEATQLAIDMISGLSENDTVLFLLSGGGSALFEKPLVSADELRSITNQLLASGADITEINTIRKRLSKVKGGKFAKLCEPAKIFQIVLSDIIGDPLDMIASGPAALDTATSGMAEQIIDKYGIKLSDSARELIKLETPKSITNVTTHISGSVRELCKAAEKSCIELGYETIILTDRLSCQARDAGSFLGAIARSHLNTNKKLAFIAGGETVVRIIGKGKGGRNQELALASAEQISGMRNAAVFSIGSDGTDGPTDAAGGYVDGDTIQVLNNQGIIIYDVLNDNDAYNALLKSDGLIITGPTGTNVNDVAVVLIDTVLV